MHLLLGHVATHSVGYDYATIAFTAYAVAAVLGALLAACIEIGHAPPPRRNPDGEGF